MFFQIILEALLITTALSIDALVSGFAYGANKIKIPLVSLVIISIICSVVLGLSLFLGAFIGRYIPRAVTLIICVVVLIMLGLTKIFDGFIKNLIKRKQGINKEIKFSFFNIKFILTILAKPEDADTNSNKILSPKEAIALAIALSVDGLAVGLGAGLMNAGVVSYIVIIALSVIINLSLLMFGRFIGNKLTQKTSLNLSWLSGLILIGLALMKIFL